MHCVVSFSICGVVATGCVELYIEDVAFIVTKHSNAIYTKQVHKRS